jgi:hypothetical protein
MVPLIPEIDFISAILYFQANVKEFRLSAGSVDKK